MLGLLFLLKVTKHHSISNEHICNSPFYDDFCFGEKIIFVDVSSDLQLNSAKHTKVKLKRNKIEKKRQKHRIRRVHQMTILFQNQKHLFSPYDR